MEVVRDLQSRFAARDALYKELNDLCFREREIRVPKAYQFYTLTAHSPLAFYALQVLTSTLCANDKQIQLAPFLQGEAGEKNASLREHWHEAAWLKQEDDAQRSLFYPFVMAQVHKGLGVLKTQQRSLRGWGSYYRYAKQLRQELSADEKLTNDERERTYRSKTDAYKREGLPFPIVTQDVVPESFWYILGEEGLTLACEAVQIPYSRAFALFKDGQSADGQAITPAALGLPHTDYDPRDGTGELLTCHTLYDHDHLCYVVEGAGAASGEAFLAKSVAHGYGRKGSPALEGPYFIAEGITTGSRRTELLQVGALWAFMEIFPLIDAAFTASGQVSFFTGWPVLEQDASAGGMGVAPDEVWGGPAGTAAARYEPGYALPVGVRFANPPRGTNDLSLFMDRLLYFVELLIPPVLRGGGSPTSGYDTNQRVHMGMLNLDQFVKNLQRTLARREAWIDQLISMIGEKVYVEHASKQPYEVRARAEYLSLGPEDVAKGRHYEVHLEPSTPSNEALLVKQLMDEKQAGWESDAGAITRLGRNPDEVLRQLQKEAILKSDPVQQYITQQVLKRIGIFQQETMDAANAQFAGLVAQGYGQTAPPLPAPGGNMLPAQGGVYAPGEGMPMTPPPPEGGGVMTPEAALAGGLPGNPGGGPSGIRRAPAGSFPLPGQRGG